MREKETTFKGWTFAKLPGGSRKQPLSPHLRVARWEEFEPGSGTNGGIPPTGSPHPSPLPEGEGTRDVSAEKVHLDKEPP